MENKKYICPICGYDGLEEPPYDETGLGSYDICPCCGYEFGTGMFYEKTLGKYVNAVKSEDEKFFKECLDLWVKSGCNWFRKENKPRNWNIKKQLLNTGVKEQEIAGLLEDYLYDGPIATFQIIDYIDVERDYSDMSDFEQERCVGFFDNMIDFWYPEIENLSTCFNKVSRKETGLNRWGVTIFPPQSLKEFYRIVDIKTPEDTPQKENLLKLIKQAQEENKYLIHYGV